MNQQSMITVWVVVGMCLALGGCGLWESNAHPDYGSTRADEICHPYGNCSGGQWVPDPALTAQQRDPGPAYEVCSQHIDQKYEAQWWKSSVSRGLEIRECMEQHGFSLKQ